MAELAWGSPEWRGERDRKLQEWLRGDMEAARCLIELSTAYEVWDDLIDRDKPVTDDLIHSGFLAALVCLNENRFWQAFQGRLMPLVITGINAWMDANVLEKGQTDKERALAFYIRNYCYEMVSMAAYCVGGWSWLRQVSLEMRMFFQHESYFTWEKRL